MCPHQLLIDEILIEITQKCQLAGCHSARIVNLVFTRRTFHMVAAALLKNPVFYKKLVISAWLTCSKVVPAQWESSGKITL